MNRFSKLAIAALAALPVFAVATPVLADSPGQLQGGTITYLVKNKTQNGTYDTSANVGCNEEARYTIRLHNTSFGAFANVNVKVSLPSAGGASNMVATTDLGGISGTSGTATVNTPAGSTQTFESGSATLYDENSNVIKTLPDSLVTSGVDIGALAGSTTEFVNFNAKVSCPTPPQVSFACTELAVNKVDRTTFDFTAKATAQNATIQSFLFTTKNASGSTVDNHTVNTNATSATYRYSQSTVGTYTVSATVNTDKGSNTSSACTKQFTVEATPTTPTTPAKPTA
jgi:hypothetical protein